MYLNKNNKKIQKWKKPFLLFKNINKLKNQILVK